MRSYTRLLFLTLIFPLALCAKANEGKIEGVLHGYVTDAVTKKPLQGVTVLAILPGTNASKQAMTDADGYFHFVQLPAAQVTVQFDKKGYQSSKRAGVTINNRAAVNLNIECLPEELGADANAEYPILRILQAS
jgi:Carboxypeptidase regulatory-like domain